MAYHPGADHIMEAGCLIVDAHTVLAKKPNKLNVIERDCVPWRYLCSQSQFSFARNPYLVKRHVEQKPVRILEELTPSEHAIPFERRFPTITELTNGGVKPLVERGLYQTNDKTLEVSLPSKYRERGIARLVQIDTRTTDDT